MLYTVGISGWEQEVLDGCLYPHPKCGPLEKLAYYSRFFGGVEVRSTFWDDSLTAADAREWSSAVSGGGPFLFMVKLHSSFTHTQNPKPKVARNIRGLLQELARQNRLGTLLMQFPYSFTNTSSNRYIISRLTEQFRGFPIHCEFRHSSWNQPELLGFLSEHAASPVSADLPRIRQLMPIMTGVTGPTAYARLHGRNEKGWLVNGLDTRYDYLYNSRELQELRRRVEALSGKSERVIIIFNNTTSGAAVANALQMLSALHAGKAVPVPAKAMRSFPFLNRIGDPAFSEPSLFAAGEYREAM